MGQDHCLPLAGEAVTFCLSCPLCRAAWCGLATTRGGELAGWLAWSGGCQAAGHGLGSAPLPLSGTHGTVPQNSILSLLSCNVFNYCSQSLTLLQQKVKWKLPISSIDITCFLWSLYIIRISHSWHQAHFLFCSASVFPHLENLSLSLNPSIIINTKL